MNANEKSCVRSNDASLSLLPLLSKLYQFPIRGNASHLLHPFTRIPTNRKVFKFRAISEMFRVGHVWSVTKSLEHFNFKISDATSELEIREFYAYYTVRDLFHASANLITRLHDYTSHVCREETRCQFVSDPSGNLEIAVRMSIPSTLATHEREGGGGGWLVAERFKGVQVDEKLPLATLTQRCMASIPRGIFNLSFNFDKSRATGEPADQRYRGTRCLFANVHRALMNLDETRRDAPGSKQMDSSLSLSFSFSFSRFLHYLLRD